MKFIKSSCIQQLCRVYHYKFVYGQLPYFNYYYLIFIKSLRSLIKIQIKNKDQENHAISIERYMTYRQLKSYFTSQNWYFAGVAKNVTSVFESFQLRLSRRYAEFIYRFWNCNVSAREVHFILNNNVLYKNPQ